MKNDPRHANAQQPTTTPDGKPLSGQQSNTDQWRAQQSTTNHPNAQYKATPPPARNSGAQGTQSAAPRRQSPDGEGTEPRNPRESWTAEPISGRSHESPKPPPQEFPGKPERDLPQPDRERGVKAVEDPSKPRDGLIKQDDFKRQQGHQADDQRDRLANQSTFAAVQQDDDQSQRDDSQTPPRTPQARREGSKQTQGDKPNQGIPQGVPQGAPRSDHSDRHMPSSHR